MRIVYDAWAKPDGGGRYYQIGRYPTLFAATVAQGLEGEHRWEVAPSGNWWPTAGEKAAGCRDMLINEEREADNDADRIQLAIDLAIQYGGIDGDHHKAWVIDQMVRLLAGDGYEQIVAEACNGEDGAETYDWDEGIAP